jgi:hypothetical protein
MTARGRVQWKDLSDKQKKQYGGDKKSFKAAKKDTAKSGGNAQSAKAIVQTYKAPASGVKGGGKAQNLLNEYKERLNATATNTTPTTAPPKAPIQQPAPQATISPDQYQSPNQTNTQTSEGSSQTNTINVGTSGNGSVAINQSNTQEFNTTQDNDIVTSTTGNDNVVDNAQDNTVKNVGGNQSSSATVAARGDAREKAQQRIESSNTITPATETTTAPEPVEHDCLLAFSTDAIVYGASRY